MPKPVIKNEGDPRQYFGMIPHLADALLKPIPFRLYGHLIAIARGNEEVEATTAELAHGCGMSEGAVIAGKRVLVRLGFIEVKNGYRHVIIIRDVWRENMLRFGGEQTRSYSEQVIATRSLYEHLFDETRSQYEQDQQTRSYSEHDLATRSPHDTSRSNSEHLPERNGDKKKKEDIDLLGKGMEVEDWKRICEELQLSLSRPTFDAWLAGSRLLYLGMGSAHHYTLVVKNKASVEWIANRMIQPITRLIQQIVIKKREPIQLHVVTESEITIHE